MQINEIIMFVKIMVDRASFGKIGLEDKLQGKRLWVSNVFDFFLLEELGLT